MQETSIIQSTDRSYLSILNQINTNHTRGISVNITLLTDNSVFVNFDQKTNHDDDDIWNNTYANWSASNLTYKLSDVVTISTNPFYIEIHEPLNKTNVFYSTKG